MSVHQTIKLDSITGTGVMLTLDRGDVLIGPLLIHRSDEDLTEIDVTERLEIDQPFVVALEKVTWKGRRIWATSYAATQLTAGSAERL